MKRTLVAVCFFFCIVAASAQSAKVKVSIKHPDGVSVKLRIHGCEDGIPRANHAFIMPALERKPDQAGRLEFTLYATDELECNVPWRGHLTYSIALVRDGKPGPERTFKAISGKTTKIKM